MSETDDAPDRIAREMEADAAEGVESLRNFDLRHDYSIESVDALEAAIPRLQRIGMRFSDDARRDNYLHGLTIVLGAYVGEAIRRCHDGTWVRVGDRIGVGLPVGFTVFPHHKVGKRLRGEADESIASFVGVLGDPRFWDSLRSQPHDPAPRPDPVRADQPVLIVCGFAREAAIAAGEGSTIIQAGADPARLSVLLAEAGPAWSAIVSFGLAGGLDPAFRVGDAVVASAVVADGESWNAEPGFARRLADRTGARLARIAGIDAPVLDPDAKAALRAASGAAIVDMESHVAAAHASRHGLPFAALRVVCDPASRTLPLLARTALRPDGGIAVGRVLTSLLARPGDLPRLVAAGRDAGAAFATLRRLRLALGPGLGLVRGVELGGSANGELVRDVP